MLTITIRGKDLWNEITEQFVPVVLGTVELEHSLAALSKWESEFEKPFLGHDEKTTEETFGYIRCMCMDPNVDVTLFDNLSEQNMVDINKYIESKMTATWFKNLPNQARSREIITAEIIYYWMITLNIPLETEHWHLNKLFTLIKVTNEKNAPAKKMPRANAAQQQRDLNRMRQQQHGTSG